MPALPKDNLRYPVLIALNDGSSGSGFYLKHSDNNLYLVSARHVLFNSEKENNEIRYKLKSNSATLLSYSNNLEEFEQVILNLDLQAMQAAGHILFDNNSDVAIAKIIRGDDAAAALDIGVVSVKAPENGHQILCVSHELTKNYAQVVEASQVFLFGYPTSLGIKDTPQIEYEKPLLRKGIVAGKNDQKKTLILDCPVFPGNSGGPVIDVEEINPQTRQFRVIGLVSEFIPFTQEWLNKQMRYVNTNIENSGYSVVVPMDNVFSLLAAFH